MSEVEIRANAMLQELTSQVSVMGIRAANLAALVALLAAENAELKKKLESANANQCAAKNSG